ncbi:hypothetical protein IJI55_00075 [Candidatus Saccharibacteria bacterium]|nr:hypothetical protein [Candidatus Saccharibacteria bacterium]
MGEKKTLEERQQEHDQHQEEQEQYEAQLEKAAELLDENGDLDASKYLDAIKAEKARRREQRIGAFLHKIRVAIFTVVFFCGLIAMAVGILTISSKERTNIICELQAILLTIWITFLITGITRRLPETKRAP